ncbi:probable WRKY transcription factor 4 [Typha latifolia]|uniref:probable WRKY transcription factor 4 n=1 Tax=Typha latifolia TaxID=4733 RepID=UPI003C2E738C
MAANGREKSTAPPPKPTITLPPRASFASLFHPDGGGGVSEASPGPLTLASSLFPDDSESDCRSFTQLLVGAMNSPAAARDSRGGGGLVRLGQNRPPSLSVAQQSMFMIPPGLSPTCLLDSPAFLPPVMGSFGMSHQQALSQVTSQAAQSPFKMPPTQVDYPSSVQHANSHMISIQDMPIVTSNTYNTIFQSADQGSQADERSQSSTFVVDKPANDGYNWRKYGQKMVKGSEFPRSYYKCTHPNCPVKKKVEHSVDGQITEIIYKGQHNHQQPPNKRSKDVGALPSESNEFNRNQDIPATSNDTTCAPSVAKRDRESGSSDSEEMGDGERRIDEADDDPGNKKRNIPTSSQAQSESKIIVQTTSEVDLLDDGYRWRKYGQKVVKGNPNPRSYYKCTYLGCNVRKHIERASADPKAVITTYEGKHNHDIPVARRSSHNIAFPAATSNKLENKQQNDISSNQAFFTRTDFNMTDHRPAAVLQLKEEHDIT